MCQRVELPGGGVAIVCGIRERRGSVRFAIPTGRQLSSAISRLAKRAVVCRSLATSRCVRRARARSDRIAITVPITRSMPFAKQSSIRNPPSISIKPAIDTSVRERAADVGRDLLVQNAEKQNDADVARRRRDADFAFRRLSESKSVFAREQGSRRARERQKAGAKNSVLGHSCRFKQTRVLFCDNEHGIGDELIPSSRIFKANSFVTRRRLGRLRKKAKELGWGRHEGGDYCPECMETM